MTLVAQAPVTELRVADLDGDGVQELVVASEEGRLERYGHGDAALATLGTLPAHAAWWDAGHGVWVVDGDGLHALDGATHALPTHLPRTDAGEPVQAHLVVDLDADGDVELLVWGQDTLQVVGAAWSPIPLPTETVIERRSEHGGQVLAVTLVPAAVAVADTDGDGTLEILVVADDVVVHGPEGERARWPLPEALVRTQDTSWTTDARWADLDGDGLVDLVAHQLHGGGTLGTTESRLFLHLGTPSGPGPAQVVCSDDGVDDFFLVDLDGDGDLDVLVPSLDLDVTNLAQAAFSRSVDVELLVLPLEDRRLGEARSLHQLALPVEGDKAAWSLFEDLDGDGLPDLAVAVGTQLQVFPGLGDRVASRPYASLELAARVEHLWAVDLDGDGPAELVGWAPGAREVSVVGLR